VADLSAHPLAVSTVIPRHATFAVALSPDDRRLALGGAGGWVRVVDTGRLAQSPADFGEAWIGHRGRVTALAWCPTRPLLASAAADSTVRLWNSETHALVARLDRHWGKVFALAFSPDGQCLASGSDDTTIRIWDSDGGDDLTQLRGHEGYVYSLAFSPDGSMLVSGSGDGTVRVWDTRPVRERWTARAAGGEGARLSPRGRNDVRSDTATIP
jgi:WD40 repeat protein